MPDNWDGVLRRESDKALLRLSMALGNPALDAENLEVALIDFAILKLNEPKNA